MPWTETCVLEPVVERYRDENLIRYFRGDAAFADPDIYCFLEAQKNKNSYCSAAVAVMVRRKR